MTATETTATSNDLTADLVTAADVESMSGEELAACVALTRGYGWYVWDIVEVSGEPSKLVRGVYSNEWAQKARFKPWDGDPAIPVCWYGYSWIKRPDRDPAAAVELLVEMANRWSVVSVGLGEDEDGEIGVGACVTDYKRLDYSKSLSQRPMEALVTIPELSTSAFCTAVCRVYLLAWQAERLATGAKEAGE